MTATWDGITKNDTLREPIGKVRHEIADAAKSYEWRRLLDLLTEHGDCINVTRPGGATWFAPLHQAAHGGAPAEVAARLIELGGWRSLRTAEGERPVDIARRRRHEHLTKVLEPELKQSVLGADLAAIQEHFHAVIQERASRQVEEHRLRLPELEILLELEAPEMWFAVPGMYGGFKFWLAAIEPEALLVTESWCRVVGGSGQRHEITARGSRLVEQGFV